MTERRLPTTIDELHELMSEFRTEEAEEQASQLEVWPDDVFISTYAKSGTTWLQQITHQLRTKGSMDFDEITVPVPWLDMAHDMGVDPLDQPWTPRVFKLHRVWEEIPPGGRVITAFRSPEGVLRSFHRFFSGSFFEEGTISIDEFAHGFFLEGTGSGLYFDYFTSYHPHLNSDDVLALVYEDMVMNPDGVVRLIADFMRIEDEEAIEIAIKQSSRSFMAEHVTKFDDHVNANAIRDRTGYPLGGLSKVHATSPDTAISAATTDAIAAKWAERVTPVLGYEDYEAFRSSLPDLLDVRS